MAPRTPRTPVEDGAADARNPGRPAVEPGEDGGAPAEPGPSRPERRGLLRLVTHAVGTAHRDGVPF